MNALPMREEVHVERIRSARLAVLLPPRRQKRRPRPVAGGSLPRDRQPRVTRGDRVPFSDSPRFADRRPRGIDAAHALRRLADHLLRKTSIAYRRAAGVKPRRRKAASTPAISVRETCPSAFAIFASIAATEAQKTIDRLRGSVDASPRECRLPRILSSTVEPSTAPANAPNKRKSGPPPKAEPPT